MIFPIGSCRVNNPVRSSSKVTIPNLGFTHCSKEALQMMKYIFRKERGYWFYEASIPCYKVCSDIEHVVVEICTVKVFYYEESNRRIYVREPLVESCKEKGLEIHSYIQSYDEVMKDLQEISSIAERPITVVGHLKPQLAEDILLENHGLISCMLCVQD